MTSGSGHLLDNSNANMTSSGSSAASSLSSSALSSISSTASSNSVAPPLVNLTHNCNGTSATPSMVMGARNTDWQTIAPPSRQSKTVGSNVALTSTDWSSLVTTKSSTNTVNGVAKIADQLCDNLNGIPLNELASSQNSLGLSIGTALVDSLSVTVDANSSSLVNGVAAAAAVASSVATVPASNLFGNQTNPIINIINNGSTCGGSGNMNGIVEDHDTSFSKNGTEILDFEPNPNGLNNRDACSNNNGNVGPLQVRILLNRKSNLFTKVTLQVTFHRPMSQEAASFVSRN